MTQIILGEQEKLESALRRFRKAVSHAGILTDYKKNRFHETPIEKRKRKEMSRRRRGKRFFR
jgi:small subunit ribosomal protein S21